MTVPLNPFVKAYDAVYALLFSGVGNELASMITIGNRVTLGTPINANRSPLKEGTTSADMPELILVDEGSQINVHVNSSQVECLQSISIYVSTGDLRYGAIASNINWYILCRIGEWRELLSNTTWNGTTFIKGIEVIPVQVGPNNPQRLQNPIGWNIIWRIILKLRINNTDLVYIEG